MGTRCMIALQLPDGTIITIHCQYDGYPNGVGQTLIRHYTDVNKIQKLLNCGDVFSLGKDIVYCSFRKLTYAFVGQRTDIAAPRRYESVSEWINDSPIDTEYHYLFVSKEDRWYISSDNDPSGFKPYTDSLQTTHLSDSPTVGFKRIKRNTTYPFIQPTNQVKIASDSLQMGL